MQIVRPRCSAPRMITNCAPHNRIRLRELLRSVPGSGWRLNYQSRLDLRPRQILHHFPARQPDPFPDPPGAQFLTENQPVHSTGTESEKSSDVGTGDQVIGRRCSGHRWCPSGRFGQAAARARLRIRTSVAQKCRSGIAPGLATRPVGATDGRGVRDCSCRPDSSGGFAAAENLRGAGLRGGVAEPVADVLRHRQLWKPSIHRGLS